MNVCHALSPIADDPDVTTKIEIGSAVISAPVVGPLAGTMSWGWLVFVSLLLNGFLVGQLLQAEAVRVPNPPASRAAPALHAPGA